MLTVGRARIGMNTRILIAVFLTMFVVCQQVHAQDEPVMPEATELEGTWDVVSQLDRGEIETATYFWRFEGNRMYYRTDDDENWNSSGAFSVNPSVIPAEIDLSDTPGIYELDGDTLTICVDLAGPRPDRFESTRNYPTRIYVLRRVEDDE